MTFRAAGHPLDQELNERPKSMPLVQRLVRAIRHDRNQVLVRTSETVFECSTHQYLNSQYSKGDDIIPICCLFSLLAYAPDSRAIELHKIEKYVVIPDEWEEIKDLPDMNELYKKATGKKTYNGLKYRIYVNQSSKTLVVAFRGSTRRMGDWIANARWFTQLNPFHDDHYDVLHAGIDDLLDAAFKKIDADNPDEFHVVSTGHSLGGGLATFAGYSAERIDDVVAINASPVTGYFSVPVGQRSKNKTNLNIYRLFEHGEVLAYFRLPLRLFYPLSSMHPKITEARFNFGIRKSFITDHSLPLFADAIWRARFQRSAYDY